MQSVCLAVLNYNGIHHLEALLPGLLDACHRTSISASIVVLDNVSTQGDEEWVKENYPQVRCVVSPCNDFLYSYNWLLEQLTEDVVVLLNNDLKVKEDFIEPLLSHFINKEVFAVSATSRNWDDTSYTCGPVKLQSHHGMYYWDFDRNNQTTCHTFFCSGGFMAVDRKKFLDLGGFNRLFWPAYGEDIDLCFRAWRKGWRCVFEPSSIVYHREHGSFNAIKNDRAAGLILRCWLLFQWSSLPEAASWFERAAIQCKYAFRHALNGDLNWGKIWLKTYFEWLRVGARYRSLKIESEELARISERVARPL